MNLSKEDEKLIRTIENTVLDVHHKKYEALGLPLHVSIPFLLKVYGDATRDSSAKSKHPGFTFRRILHQLILSISQSIKWVIKDAKPTIEVQPLTYIDINPTINDLVRWSFEYTGLAQQFTAWSRGFVDVSIDAPNKKVTFLPIDKSVHYFYYSQQEINDDHVENLFDQISGSSTRVGLYNTWIDEYRITSPPIASYMDWSKARSSDFFEEVLSALRKLVLPELSESTDLGGYTLEDFRIFFGALFINFDFICSFEHFLDSHYKEQAEAFGTNPIILPKDKMIDLLVQATELDESIISKIIIDLTLDPANFHSNLITQPIVEFGNELAIMTNLFAYIDPNRMISGALNKSLSKKKIYDRLINKIEDYNTQSIAKFLEGNSAFQIIRKTFKGNDKKISPDFVLIHPGRKSILIIDYKHFLNPINASETAYKMTEVNKGFMQINSCENFFNEFPDSLLELEVTVNLRFINYL